MRFPLIPHPRSGTLAITAFLLLSLDATAQTAASAELAERFAETTAVSAPPANTLVNRAAELTFKALSLLGVNYKYGGTTPESGFDCSGLVRHVFQTVWGLTLPRRSVEISRIGEKISRKELQPGDLVFFNTLRRTFSHVGIYLGNNRFIHAPSRNGEVRIDDMNGDYWVKRFNGARRIEADNPGAY